MKQHFHLLIIDPQNDFCDLPAAYRPVDAVTGQTHAPALPVAGAHADMLRVAALIRAGAAGLQGISVTLDSHHRLDIAHPPFWRDAEGRQVAPFTQITAADVRAARFTPRDAQSLPRALHYLDALEAAGRYTLMVWPVHCEIGTWGHNVHDAVRDAYHAWEEVSRGSVNKVIKGTNPWTEHYSALMAEVPDEHDPGTQLNQPLIDLLSASDRLYIVGEAASHCVKASTEHIVEHLDRSRSEVVLLTDCMSPVGGFDTQYADFVRDMRAKGVRITTSEAVLPELLANAA
jgi:nicotinamidase-related amidase